MIDFFVLNINYFILAILGFFIIKLLLSIESELQLLHDDISQTNQELNKLLNTLMTSLNDVRKLVNLKIKPARKDHL